MKNFAFFVVLFLTMFIFWGCQEAMGPETESLDAPPPMIHSTTPPPPDCDDGNCVRSPGYWKNHLDAWPPSGLSPDDDFDTTFGVDFFSPDITLFDAVNLKGGGIKKVARHGTAALLNASHPAVNYPLSVAEVIAAVQAGDVESLAEFNELSASCPAEN